MKPEPLAPPPDWLAPYDARDENERMFNDLFVWRSDADLARISGNPIVWLNGLPYAVPTDAECEREARNDLVCAHALGMDMLTYQLHKLAESCERFRQGALAASLSFEAILPRLEEIAAEERERLRLLGQELP